MIRVLVVDDQNTVQKIIENYLKNEEDIEIVGFAHNGQIAIEKVEEFNPDLVIMDIEMPVMNGLKATKIISDRFVNTKVLLLTSNENNEEYLKEALKVGARGYLLKSASSNSILEAIRAIYKGYFHLGPGLLERYLERALKSQYNPNDLSELKEIIQKQSQIIENINVSNSDSEKIEKKIDNSRFVAEIKNINFEFRNIKSRLVNLEKELSFFRKLILTSILFLTVVVILGLIIPN